jgi:hypothetical protein
MVRFSPNGTVVLKFFSQDLSSTSTEKVLYKNFFGAETKKLLGQRPRCEEEHGGIAA